MTNEQLSRFSMLRQEWCAPRLVHELYGVGTDEEPRFWKHFKSWTEHQGKEAMREDGSIHRFRLETFLQAQKLLTRKWAAVRLGMKETALTALLGDLERRGVLVPRYPSEQPHRFIGEKLGDSLLVLCDDLRFRTFADHNGFCRRLHSSLQEAFGVAIEPEYDITTRAMASDPQAWDYSHDWDAIALEPVGLQHQVWLDLGKPMNLRLDCCSLLLYAQDRELLRGYVAGSSEPELPDEVVALVQKKAAG